MVYITGKSNISDFSRKYFNKSLCELFSSLETSHLNLLVCEEIKCYILFLGFMLCPFCGEFKGLLLTTCPPIFLKNDSRTHVRAYSHMRERTGNHKHTNFLLCRWMFITCKISMRSPFIYIRFIIKIYFIKLISRRPKLVAF